jgi:hypothetical protein
MILILLRPLNECVAISELFRIQKLNTFKLTAHGIKSDERVVARTQQAQ